MLAGIPSPFPRLIATSRRQAIDDLMEPVLQDQVAALADGGAVRDGADPRRKLVGRRGVGVRQGGGLVDRLGEVGNAGVERFLQCGACCAGARVDHPVGAGGAIVPPEHHARVVEEVAVHEEGRRHHLRSRARASPTFRKSGPFGF